MPFSHSWVRIPCRTVDTQVSGIQEMVKKKRGYIRSLSTRANNPSHDETFNEYNSLWMHAHFKELLAMLMSVHPTVVPQEIIGDLLVCF